MIYYPYLNLLLLGSSNFIEDTLLQDNLNNIYLEDINTPDFIASEKRTSGIWRFNSAIYLSYVCVLLFIGLLLYAKINKAKLIKLLIYLDFLPITGGYVKTSNGGVITLYYIILVVCIVFAFIVRINIIKLRSVTLHIMNL